MKTKIIRSQYEIKSPISINSYFHLYHVKDLVSNQMCIIKEYSVNKKRLADKEVQILKNLHDESFFNVIEWFTTEEYVYVVYENKDILSLKEYLMNKRTISYQEAKNIIMQACDAYLYLKKTSDMSCNGYLNLDTIYISKQNKVMIDLFGYLNIKFYPSIHCISEYSAPEIQQGKADEQSDIYTLGMIFNTMLTGEITYDRKRKDITREVKQMIEKATSYEKPQRYQTIEEFKINLLNNRETNNKKSSTKPLLLSAVLSVCFLGLGFFLDQQSLVVKENTYQKYVQVYSNDVEQDMEFYYKAIEMYPERGLGYLKVFEALKRNDDLNSKGIKEIMSVGKTNEHLIDTSISIEQNIRKSIVYAYLNDANETKTIKEHLELAKPYIERLQEQGVNSFDIYLDMLNKANKGIDELQATSHQYFIEQISLLIERENVDDYEQLMLYQSILHFIAEQKQNISIIDPTGEVIEDFVERIEEKLTQNTYKEQYLNNKKDKVISQCEECEDVLDTIFQQRGGGVTNGLSITPNNV